MNNGNQHTSGSWRFLFTGNVFLFLTIAAWFITPAGVAGSQARSANLGITVDQKDEDALRKMYDEMSKLILKGDKTAYGQFFTEDFVLITSQGTTATKKEVLEELVPASGTKLEAFNFSELKLRVSGELAVVTYLTEVAGQREGRRFKVFTRNTDTWEKKAGKWQRVASHLSLIQ